MNLQKAFKYFLLLLIVGLWFSTQLIAQASFFVQNKGQVFDQNGTFNKEVNYVLSLKGYNVSFYKNHFSYELFSTVGKDSTKLSVERIEIWFDGASPEVKIIPSKLRNEVTNVFKNGKSFPVIKSFEKIYYKNILDGIDLEFFVSKNQLKYNYIISNKVIKSINLKVKGARVEKKQGNIYLKAKNREIKETIPESYFLKKEGQKEIEQVTINTAKNRIQYLLPNDRAETFVIDPIAYGNEYTTYFGGAHLDFAESINTSKADRLIIAGYTVSTNNIATTGAYQTTISDQDAFIASFDQQGNRIWSTYFGGESQERCYSAVLDSNDNIFIAGNTTSQIGLSTPGSYQQYISSGDDAFITKFSPSGMLLWSSYYGGDGHELITTIATDDSNKIYVTGHTASTDLQCTPNAFRNTMSGYENAFLGVFNNDGVVIYNSYYIKGSSTKGAGIAVAKDGSIYFSGHSNDNESITYPSVHQSQNGGYLDGFLIKLDAQYQMVWKTYIGGEQNDLIESMAIDSLQNIYVVGKTKSTTAIATANSLKNTYTSSWDGFVVKFDSSCTRKWGTYINGGNNEELRSIALKDSTLWLLGITNGNALVIDSTALQYNNNGGFDNIIINLSDTGGLIWSTYFGSNSDEFGSDIKMNKNNKILISGHTASNSNIATLNAHQTSYGGNLYDGFWSILCKPVMPTLLSQLGSITVCEGDSVTVNSIYSFDSYLWSSGDTTSSLAIKQSGDYTLKTKDLNNCPGRSDTLSVTVVPSSDLSLQQSNSTICHEDSVLLSVNSTYSSYQWSSGETTPTIHVSDNQSYSLSVTNSFGCQYFSDTITLNNSQYEYPIQIIGDTVICSGGESILFTNSGLSSLTWNTLETTNSIAVNTTGSHWFSGLDTNSCPVVSDTVLITQVNNPTPSVVLDTVNYFSVCINDTVKLVAENDFLTYEWSTGELTQSLEITASGDYYVEAKDTNGCVGISDSIQVVFNPLPVVEIAPLPDTLCFNDSVFISATTNLENYSWSTGESDSNYYFSLDSLGVYQITLQARGLNSCYNQDSVTFNVIDCLVFNNVEETNKDRVKIVSQLRGIGIESSYFIERLKLIDYQGKVIFSKNNLNTNSAFIEIDQISNSIYILEVFFVGEKTPSIKKISVIKK